jgi:hypothetical protein
VMGRDSEPESIVVVPLSHRNPAPRLISLHDLRRCDHLDDYLHDLGAGLHGLYVQTPNRMCWWRTCWALAVGAHSGTPYHARAHLLNLRHLDHVVHAHMHRWDGIPGH